MLKEKHDIVISSIKILWFYSIFRFPRNFIYEICKNTKKKITIRSNITRRQWDTESMITDLKFLSEYASQLNVLCMCIIKLALLHFTNHNQSMSLLSILTDRKLLLWHFKETQITLLWVYCIHVNVFARFTYNIVTSDSLFCKLILFSAHHSCLNSWRSCSVVYFVDVISILGVIFAHRFPLDDVHMLLICL